MKQAIILFTRALEDGNIKSRLSDYLTIDQRSQLHCAFLEDIANTIVKAKEQLDDIDLVLCSTKLEIPLELKNAFAQIKDKEYLPQRGEDFRSRLINSFKDSFALGYESCIMLGSDCIEVSAADIRSAFRSLKTSEKTVVFSPSEDGGFCLAGINAPLLSELFDIEEYGTSKTLKKLMARAKQMSLECVLLETRHDIDTLFDLQLLYRRGLCKSRSSLPHATCRAIERLASIGIPVAETPISIIVPTYNEASSLDALHKTLVQFVSSSEIIVVDGGSTDGTAEVLSQNFHVIASDKGRGKQLNAGVKIARGDAFFFLHADSKPPHDALEQIRAVLRTSPAGCFGIEFPHSTIAMRCCQALSNFRARRRHIMFGDQGIFMKRTLFEELGGYRDIPLMEDYQLSLDLRERGIRYGMTEKRILTSDRRFGSGMTHQLFTMRKMALLRKRYRQGESPEELAREYREIR